MQPRTWFRHPSIDVLVLGAVALAASLGGCASGRHGGTPDDTGSLDLSLDGGSGAATYTSDCPSGLQSITVTPASTTVSVTYPQQPGAITLTATGTFSGGQKMNVTDCVTWSTEPDLGTVINGMFTPPGGGQFTLTAGSGSVSGTATVTVKLTGSVNPSNVDTANLDGTPGSSSPTIAYPIDGALFPYHLGDLAFQVVPSDPSQTVGRVHFQGDTIDLDVYGPCTPVPSAALAGGCSIAIPADLEDDLVGASAAPTITETVRLAAADGSNLAESTSIGARWSSTPLSGTIYYWSTPPHGMSGSSEIIRMNLATPGTPPEVYYTNLDAVPYSSALSGGWACVGCHAISRDGTKLGITIAGSSINANGDGYGSLFALLDVASKTPTATRVNQPGTQQLLNDGFATETAFTSDGSSMVQVLQGQLYLRSADSTLASQGPLFPSMTESMTMPSLSSAGDSLVFASWVPTLSIPHAYDSKDLNGNETPNAQIWLTSVSGTTFGTPRLLVPRVSNATEYYPAVSDDGAFVVFNESSCSGPPTSNGDGYGLSPCDSYDDPSARLRLVRSNGGAPTELDRASGRTSAWPQSDTWTNSWPRFAPDHGTFRGQPLYWIAFSSRRPYGVTLSGSADGSTPPQIWFAAVTVAPDGSGWPSGDPSFAPVWLPQQNSATPEILPDGGTSQTLGGDGQPTGNHIPQWVVKYVPYVPPTLQ
jgi:hypothetical protein